jgi:fumarylacetoacetate (FAA) hydrolase
MKLATLQDGSRNGMLVVVSRDLQTAHHANGLCPSLQSALDNWDFYSPQLEDLSTTLNHGRARHAFAFDPKQCLAPLPRAYQWADGSAYVTHVELVRRARGAEMPPSFWTDPLMYQGGSDDLLGACAPIVSGDEAWGIDFEAEVAVITDDVPMGVTPADAASHIRLVMLANDVSLRNLIPAELSKGFGFVQSKPATAFSPVAVTPDELGAAWDGRKLHGAMRVTWNGKHVGRADAGVDMAFDFAQLIAHLAKTRRISAGSIVGSGTVSNQDSKAGYSCIAEQRAREMIAGGEAHTPYLSDGDTVRIEMLDLHGASWFGAIDQAVQVRAAQKPKSTSTRQNPDNRDTSQGSAQ